MPGRGPTVLALALTTIAAAIAQAGFAAAAPLRAPVPLGELRDQPVAAAVPSSPVGPPSPPAAIPPASAPISEGTSLWYSCINSTWSGPASLSCPQPYDPRYLTTFLRGFSRFTPENELKMAFLEPQQNRFDFSVADRLAEFAQSAGRPMRGHTLVWNQEMPGWVTNPLLPWTKDTLLPVLRNYISTVVGHFAQSFPGVIREWDVVNEPLDEQGNLQANLWESVIGPEYIADALEAAHAAAPGAQLVINDEGTELPGPKGTAMLNLARSLKQAGVPLDVVGLESHVTPGAAPPLGYLVWLMRQYAQAGLDVEITELDVSDDGLVDDPVAKQAVFRRYAEACHLSANCIGFGVWGVADQYSWLGPTSDALLYDTQFRPRPVVATIHQLLANHVIVVHAQRRRGRRQPRPAPRSWPR